MGRGPGGSKTDVIVFSALDSVISVDDPVRHKARIRSFDFMVGKRKVFWADSQKDQAAVVFVGGSLTGGWKNLAKDFPKLNVANRCLGGDTSRRALFRFKLEALGLNPKAVVIAKYASSHL